MKKIIKYTAFLMFASMLAVLLPEMKVSAAPAQIDSSGTYWEVSADGTTLTISGTGDIPDFTRASDTPWYSQRNSITKVVIGDGITGIGKYAFCDFTNLNSVDIPDTVTSIGYGVFKECSSLSSVNLPSNLTLLRSSVFQNSGLTEIIIPASVTKINGNAFYNTRLTEITIPASVTYIETDAFRNCQYLTKVTFEKVTAGSTIGSSGGTTNVATVVIQNADSQADAERALYKTFNAGSVAQIPAGKNIVVPTTMKDNIVAAVPNASVETYDDYLISHPNGNSNSNLSSNSNSNSSSEENKVSGEVTVTLSEDFVETYAAIYEINNSIQSANAYSNNIRIVCKYCNSFSYDFMRMLEDPRLSGKTIYIEYDYQGKHYTVAIPGGTKLPVETRWYGPLFLYSLYGVAK